MNKTIELIKERKSVRVFTNIPVEKEKKAMILDSCIQAPTAGNMQLYSIIDITSEELKQKLSVLCDNQAFITKASLVLIFLADPTKWYANYNKVLNTDKAINPSIADYFLAINDALIAAQNSVIAAESLSLGSCYIGDIVENYEEIRSILELPEGVFPVSMVIYGYPTIQQKSRKKPTRFEQKDLIYENAYDKTIDPHEMLVRRYVKEFKNISIEEAQKNIDELITTQYNRKQNTNFFKEMNRSLSAMLNSIKSNNKK